MQGEPSAAELGRRLLDVLEGQLTDTGTKALAAALLSILRHESKTNPQYVAAFCAIFMPRFTQLQETVRGHQESR